MNYGDIEFNRALASIFQESALFLVNGARLRAQGKGARIQEWSDGSVERFIQHQPGAKPQRSQSSQRRLSDNPANVSCCHSESFRRLRINSAKNLIDSGTYTYEILRLPPQNDVVGQPQRRYLCQKRLCDLVVDPELLWDGQ